MSRRNGKAPRTDLKLNLTRPRVLVTNDSPRRSATPSPTSPPISCISSDTSQDDLTQLGYYSSSPEAQSSMVLAGCQRCLMYIMLSEEDPKCPRCHNTVLLEFMQQGNDDHTAGSTSGASSAKKTRKNR
uniref:GIR1-like zinc ribbon domain-containing protein n=1 Tax=Kalanchoe fedtschenkoi TaxID=63787 RepID=A0A7N0RGH5_KALFE